MKKLLSLMLLLSLVIKVEAQQKPYNKPEKVIITGQVLNDNVGQVKLDVYQLGFEDKTLIDTKLDSLGRFALSFETYLPTEVRFQYGNYTREFPILTHPKDSIHLVFDGAIEDREAFLKSIKFSGDAQRSNQDVVKFEQFVLSKPLKLFSTEHFNFARHHYDVPQYESYLDSLKQEIEVYNKDFVKRFKPNEEVRLWAKFRNKNKYYYAVHSYILAYVSRHRGEKFPIISYTERLKELLPLKKSLLINTLDLNRFANAYFHFRINPMAKNKYASTHKLKYNVIPFEKLDSINIHSTIDDVADPLMRDLALMNQMESFLNEENITSFEAYKTLVEKEIKEPYLIKPLIKKYNKIVERSKNLKSYTKKVMASLEGTKVKPIIDSIWLANKGKVIYLDCWSTYCGPCIAQMPTAKELHKRLKGYDVAFVYLCLDSPKHLWEKRLNKLRQPGQHFYLDDIQSREMAKAFGVRTFPYHLLVDKNGIIVKQDCEELDPRHAEALILEEAEK